MLVESAPTKSMLPPPVGDICTSALHVARGPSMANASASNGNGGSRQSQANRSNIGTSLACRSKRLPMAKLTGEIISTAKAPTLKSKPTVPQIISRPIAATPMPAICIRVGISRNASTANATVNSAWLCTITLASPTGTPCAIPQDCARNCPRNSVALIAISTLHDTFGRRTNRHGSAAMAKRIAVIRAGDSSSSASRLATNASPQITATRMARKMSAGFTLLALRAVFGFAQQIGAVQRCVIVGREQREADIGQHPLDHPAEGRIFVAHMGDHAVAVEIVVLDAEIGPRFDIALRAVRGRDEHDVAQVKIGAGLQRGMDPRQRHRLPEIRQMMQGEFADDQVVGVRLVGEAQQSGGLGADRDLAVP